MHKLFKQVFFCGVALFTCTMANAQFNKTDHYDFSPVYNKIKTWVDSGYYNGASIIIAKDNHILYEKYFGSYDSNTVAYIASAGKWLAAATIAAVVDEGKLSWNDKVKKWMPEFKDVKGEATLRQLLSHTAGYPDYQPAGKHSDDYQTLREAVANIVDLPADTLPGTKFKYGGLAMQVAGRMAELATGKSWETIFQEKIAKPLQMRSTHFTPVDTTPGHNPMIGGGARATLHDYARFLQMILNYGKYNGKRVLSASAVNELQANQVNKAIVNKGEYVERARATFRKDVYGLGEWRDEVGTGGEATLISSPSWAGAYPWVDRKNNVYGFFLTRITNMKEGFSSFYASPVLPMLVRDALKNATHPEGKHAQTTPAVWQWSVQVDSLISKETNDFPRAFLWVPENCKRVRAVVFTQHNMVEEGMLEHPQFRKTMSEQGIAEVWVTPGINMPFDFTKGAGEHFNYMMKLLAGVSGYQELTSAPIIPLGHSAYATFPWNFAAWNRDRTLALVSVHGDAPQTKLTGYGGANVDWGNRNIDGVPALFIMGEYEWWEDRLTPAFSYIAKHPQSVINLFCDAGHGHFDYSDEMIDYVCLFIKKAALKRLSNLTPVDPQKGWIMDRWHKDSLPMATAAPYALYKGNRQAASWVFDEEMANATERFYAASRGKQQQFIGFKQQGKILQPDKSHANYSMKFIPLEDGISFTLNAFFADSSRTNPANDFAKTPLLISRICGPVKKVNDTTFQLNFNRVGFNNPKRSFDIWMLACNKGDEKYKSAVQQLDMKFPPQNTTGVAQVIQFDSIANQKKEITSLKLNAVSSAGLPVSFFVREGPAYINGNVVRFTTIPPRTKFPLKITVVAWQYGIAGKVQTAKPVEHTFYLVGK